MILFSRRELQALREKSQNAEFAEKDWRGAEKAFHRKGADNAKSRRPEFCWVTLVTANQRKGE